MRADKLYAQTSTRAVLITLVFFVFAGATQSISAATYTVDTTADDAALSACTAAANDCSLRGAIARANATINNDTINFALPAGINTIDTSGELAINNAGSLTITNSTEAINLLIYGDGNSRIFLVNGGANVTLNAVTVKGGYTGGLGGGIANYGSMSLTNSVVSRNTAFNGGGIYNRGSMSLTNTTVSRNTANTNGPGGGGGGIANDGTLSLLNSTVSGNEVTIYDGGGIFNESALTIINSTVSGNTARIGGGIYNSAAGRLTLTSVTVAFNSAVGGDGGGVRNFRGTATLRNTIVGQNAAATSSADFEGAIASASSFNLIGSGTGMTGITNGTNGNQVGVDPKLDPTLAPNGGTTQTHALLPDSTAIDRGNDTGTDQRGFTRPIDLPNYANATGGNGADIGAFEAQSTPPALPRTVDTNADNAALTACTAAPNDCSLRGAVSAANASPFPDSINFDAGITNITLTSQITVNNAGSLSINGPGANILTIDGGAGTNRIFSVDGAEVTIQGVTLSGGNGAGAAANLRGGGLVLESVVVQNNSGLGAFAFGAIALQGTGGVTAGVVIRNSTISGNTNFTGCPAIYAVDGVSLNVTNTTVSGNSTTATGFGAGGICVWGNSSATFRSTTISGNAGGSGGNGSGGGGIYIQNTARVDLGNTIVAGNTSAGLGPDLYRFDDGRATFYSATGNVIGDNSGNPAAPNTTVFPTGNPNANGDKVGTAGNVINPLLAPLANNGGTTPTCALLSGSPAIDAGRNSLATAFGPTTDQRGGTFARIKDGNNDGTATIDSGAFEAQFAPLPPTAAAVSISGRVMTINGRGIRNVRLSLTDSSGQIRTATSTAFGYYRFDDVQAGETYILSAVGKRYTFSQPVQVLNINEETNGVDFIANSE